MTRVRLGLILTALSCAEPTATSESPTQAAIVEQELNHSYSIDPVGRSVYVRFTDVRNEGGEPAHVFMRRVFESADSVGATRLVLDLRSISESDTFVLVPLLKGVIARDQFRERGGLMVLVGNDSFSPRQNAATLLQQYANPIFVYSPAFYFSARRNTTPSSFSLGLTPEISARVGARSTVRTKSAYLPGLNQGP
jgi:hypothetical protein